MVLKICSYSMLYIVVAWILGTCYGFVLLSSAAGQNGDVKLFVPGEEIIYNLHSTVLLDEKNNENGKNVGFFISGQVSVQCIWEKSNDKILKFKLLDPKLHIKSRKAPSPDGFIYHTSKLEEYQNGPFYAHWQNGKIGEVLVNNHETLSLLNIKKGIAGLFQIQLIDGASQEVDSSGSCSVEYTSQNPHKIIKTKRDCKSDLPYLRNPEISLDAVVTSSRNVDYDFDKNFRFFKRIRSQEKHLMSLSSNENFGSEILSDHLLDFVEYTPDKVTILSGKTSRDVLEKLISSEGLHEETLKTERELLPTEDVKSFPDSVNELRDQLKPELLGKAASAKAFVKLVSIARKATKEDVKKTLNAKKNKQIMPQLFDILGASPTLPSYEAVISQLDFTKEDQLDNYERYLWSLSLGAHQNPDVIEKIYIQFKKTDNIPPKLNETMLLTLASMSYRLNRVTQTQQQVTQKIEKLLLEKLRVSEGEQSYPWLRALRNLRSPTTIPDLLKKIKEGTTKEGVYAWRAILALDKLNWTTNVLKAARNAFLQLDRKYDTSSRTIASEILLESNPDDQTLKEIIYFIGSNDTVYEVKQYALQKLRMMAEDDLELHQKVTKIIRADEKFKNNYYVLNPRGLSTAIKRYFVKNQSGNGSLVSLQEINNAVVKRGVVNLLWDNKQSGGSELFSLGIFTSGLSSFISSEGEGVEEEPEVASAGMELAVLGTQFRPFVFFSGQGELMGHVWSGTASERTTAYQALIMLQDHSEYIHLGSGFVMEIDLKGAVSFDLAGKIEISLWGRNAQSLVEKCAGIFVSGSMKIDSSIVRSEVQFSASVEPQLKLNSDIDFSSTMKFCMRLSQVDVLLRYNTFKIERIPGSKHKLRFNKYRKSSVPGMTYALNRKNNEMCSAIHQ